MSLIEIKRHLMTVKKATLSNLCVIFKTDPDTMRCMLRHLVQKGCVRKCLNEPACGTKCFKCPTTVMEVYEWCYT